MKTHFQNLSFLIICIFCFNLLVFSANAQTKKISLQGFLKDANGKAIADGTQSVTFTIYDAAIGGSALWSEVQSLKVFGGVYSAQLGSVSNTLSSLLWDKPYFVGVTVQLVELTPRTELTYAPYSFGTFRAQVATRAENTTNADLAKEVVCSGAVGDVKYSILNPTQFATVNGTCWVPMDGGSMSGSKLANLIGGSSVPNAGGLFLRSQEFGNSINYDHGRDSDSPIATVEDHASESHQHTNAGTISDAGVHSHSITLQLFDGRSTTELGSLGGYYNPNLQSRDLTRPMIAATDRLNEGTLHTFDGVNAGIHSHTLSGSTGLNTNTHSSTETRPVNLNLYIYIRIN